jgi:hypothetical protein
LKLPVPTARLIEKRSDEQDNVALTNQIRDTIVNQRVDVWPQQIQTADATMTSIWSDQLPADSVGDFTMVVVGQTAASGDVGGYRRRVVVRRVGTGAVAVVGAGVDIIGVDKETVAGWDAGFALDAATPGLLYAVVTGAAATAINWRAHITGSVRPWE